MAAAKEEKKQSFSSTHRYWCKHVEPTKKTWLGEEYAPKAVSSQGSPNLDSHIEYDGRLFLPRVDLSRFTFTFGMVVSCGYLSCNQLSKA